MNELLEETKEAFGAIKGSVVVAMQKLYEVFTSEAWREVSDSWGDYVESELGVSQGFASKLLTVNKTYLLEGAVSPEKLAGIDYEKLYMARNLEGPIELRIEKARTLKRSDLRKERQDDEPHPFEELIICKVCHGSKENHS